MVSFTKINRPVELLGAAYYENSCYMIEDGVRAFGQKLLRTLGTRIMKYSAYGIRIRTFVTVGGAFVDCARTTHVRLQIIMLLFLHYNIYNTESFPLFYCERISHSEVSNGTIQRIFTPFQKNRSGVGSGVKILKLSS